jgi:hypothetical protein
MRFLRGEAIDVRFGERPSQGQRVAKGVVEVLSGQELLAIDQRGYIAAAVGMIERGAACFCSRQQRCNTGQCNRGEHNEIRDRADPYRAGLAESELY